MTEFRRVSSHFAVAAQLGVSDISRAAAEGYRTIVVNRPDGEDRINRPVRRSRLRPKRLA